MNGIQRIEVAAGAASVGLGVLAVLMGFAGIPAAALLVGVLALVPAAFALGMVVQRIGAGADEAV